MGQEEDGSRATGRNKDQSPFDCAEEKDMCIREMGSRSSVCLEPRCGVKVKLVWA